MSLDYRYAKMNVHFVRKSYAHNADYGKYLVDIIKYDRDKIGENIESYRANTAMEECT